MNRLRTIRESKEYSLADVAKGVGTTPMTIQRFEAGTRNISLNWLTKLANFYQVDISELVSDKTPADKSKIPHPETFIEAILQASLKSGESPAPKLIEAAKKGLRDRLQQDAEDGAISNVNQLVRVARSIMGDNKRQ